MKDFPKEPRFNTPHGVREDLDANDQGEMETVICIGCGQTFTTNTGDEVCPKCEHKEDQHERGNE